MAEAAGASWPAIQRQPGLRCRAATPRVSASFKSDATANPFVVEIIRGGMVESRHRAAVAVVDADGKVVRAWGDVERPVYGRSAIKPLQALPLIESGAADKYNVSVPEIALACASHNGEPRHVELVQAWLSRIGCSVGDLECGGHMPYHEASVEAMIRAGTKPSAATTTARASIPAFSAPRAIWASTPPATSISSIRCNSGFSARWSRCAASISARLPAASTAAAFR